MSVTETQAWTNLTKLADALSPRHLRDLFAADPQRFARFSLRQPGLLLDISKQRITPEIWAALLALWQESKAAELVAAMKNGEPINNTENRAVLHYALRHQGESPVLCQGKDVMPGVRDVLQRLKRLCDDVHQGRWRGATGKPIRQVVNIGIGGSDLGSRMAAHALAAHRVATIKVHFVANLDGAELESVVGELDPAETLFIVSSKTFTTQETMRNAMSARAWLVAALGDAAVERHFVAVSTQVELTKKFGIAPQNVFEFWDWVGGRFSIWSAIGLPLALAVGYDNFERFLAGAAAMDEHFFAAPPAENLPIALALVDVWNINFLGADNRAVLPYSHSLGLLSRFLEQLEMESNGKAVDRNGYAMRCPTAPITWGEAGTNGQHAFYQLIHQGGRLIPCEFLAVAKPDHALPDHHDALLANCFAQAEALMQGKTLDEAKAELRAADLPPDEVERLAPFKVFPGNQPSTTLVLDALSPDILGRLLALYEHKTACLGAIWNINSFDQWGVEYGKQLANRLLPAMKGGAAEGVSSSTAGLIAACRA